MMVCYVRGISLFRKGLFAALLFLFLAPLIDAKMEPSGDSFQISIRVDPGEPVRVSEVNIVFEGDITHQEAS